jgi:hypothetical protein
MQCANTYVILIPHQHYSLIAIPHCIPIHMLVDMNHSIHITITQLQAHIIIICCQLVNSIFRIQFGSISLNESQFGSVSLNTFI